MSSGTTLVTGAAGFVGSHLLDRLQARTPLVAWRRPEGTAPRNLGHVEWHTVDMTDRQDVISAFARVAPARVYHLAGAADVESAWRNAVPHLQVNVLGTHHLLEAVRLAGHPCRVLVVSSAQVYQPSDEPIGEDAPLVPANPYGLSKLAQDHLAMRAAADEHLDIVVARPFNHVGPRQNPAFAVSSFARQIARIEAGLAPPVLSVGNLDARRDITDVRDVTAAYELLMERGQTGRAYNVCSGRAWRMRDLLEELVQLAGTTVHVEIDPARIRPIDIPIVQGDASRIRAESGWLPHTRVEHTLRDTLDWWRREVRADANAGNH